MIARYTRPEIGAVWTDEARMETWRKVEVAACGDLASAVGRGYRWARPDGVVLLSPAAPSFGRFRDYRDRGEAFARAMRACTG